MNINTSTFKTPAGTLRCYHLISPYSHIMLGNKPLFGSTWAWKSSRRLLN